MPPAAKILLIRLSSIGDVLHCTPVARALKTAWPASRLTWLTGAVAADLLAENPYIDELHVWPRETWEAHLRNHRLAPAWQLSRDLRQWLLREKFDIVLDVHGLFITGLIAYASRAGIRIGLGRARELNWLFMTKTAPIQAADRHVIQQYLSILRPLGIASSDYRMVLNLPERAKSFAVDFFRQNGLSPAARPVVIIPTTTWPTKNWPPEYFSLLAAKLSGHRPVLLCGGPADRELTGRIAAAAGVPLIDATGKTGLLEMAALLARAGLVITGDTGPLHMAVALDIPTVSIFGPTEPARFGPLPPGHAALRATACSPCYKTACPRSTAVCTAAVTPQEVLQAITRLIDL